MKNIFKITKLLIDFYKNDTNKQKELYDDILQNINKQEILETIIEHLPQSVAA